MQVTQLEHAPCLRPWRMILVAEARESCHFHFFEHRLFLSECARYIICMCRRPATRRALKTQLSSSGIAQHVQQNDERLADLQRRTSGRIEADDFLKERTRKNANRLLERSSSHLVAIEICDRCWRHLSMPHCRTSISAPGVESQERLEPGSFLTRAETVRIMVGR